jgi:alcohol dehydrogenase class IV
MNFEMVFNRQVLFGENKIDTIASHLLWRNCKKAFLATFNMNNAVYEKVSQLLREASINFVPYEIRQEPTIDSIDTGRDLFLKECCDCTIALGGGSVIDTAKAVGMLAVNGGNAEDYQMFGREVTVEPPFFIAIPTTSGTGAEATKTSVVTNTNNGLKKSMYHNSMIADLVIMDPTLTVGLPQNITSATGMDALSHAIESYVSLNATPITESCGLKAMELVINNLQLACEEPGNLTARANMMLASYLGGVAISAGIGIAHIMAQPLGGEFHIPHGDACSIFLPHAMRLNFPYAEKKFVDIAKALGVYEEKLSTKENAERAIKRIKRLQADINAPSNIGSYLPEGTKFKDLVDVIRKTTGHITCNPRPLTEDLMREIYSFALT